MEKTNKLRKRKLEPPRMSEDVPHCESPSKVFKSDQTGVFIPGNHEAEMCYGGEADLHKHVTGCKKNPGHKGFIPLKDFKSNCLPSRYHDDKIVSKTIKTLAALTVQVSVGQWTRKREREEKPITYTRYWYTTCTCPGSSGATVFRLDYDRLLYTPHSGSNSEGNYSGEHVC
ncbi:uncharacterized protein LOC131935637 isoform X2 [Physella acuta]|uniref:uncharacterized protein LOC131935637 isoform X2 n=1 Tax=Physella acuta TaxID=109671 RepID=UPI0027DB87C4|nr:uncharacterized protein LOC131935637 isoform X2 [Physella acuta]